MATPVLPYMGKHYNSLPELHALLYPIYSCSPIDAKLLSFIPMTNFSKVRDPAAPVDRCISGAKVLDEGVSDGGMALTAQDIVVSCVGVTHMQTVSDDLALTLQLQISRTSQSQVIQDRSKGLSPLRLLTLTSKPDVMT